ncbi:acyl-CoA dehydratase activase [Ferrimonas aestuarii]|uniref:2-hydroxyglutaryl-CoA dehydratase n=1 Tax=Ferrimonas aestuarii TaxID=2569539 RepID=A0A4U1BPX2_9GAMM|nr:acyl-CoA dehydratase activase [Ferrimonas aestuarii]TKB54702.1 2-hydroxyglutaryl-CoA dehydratase [Ferrimonas aestuarii]
MLTCGIDIGSRTIKGVLVKDGQLLDWATGLSGATPQANAQQLFHTLLETNGLKSSALDRTLATGYGRNYFDDADKVSSEIICHSAGLTFLQPQVRTIIDIGGQDSKVIKVAPSGKVLDFVMNDRCAAGTGKFLEMVAHTLNLAVEDIGRMAASSEQSCEISSMCAVFAESEIISLIHQGVPTEVILKGVCDAVAKRIVSLGRKIGFDGPIGFSGGVAQNLGVAEAIEARLNTQVLIRPERPQITGALGAALIAQKGL